MSLRLKISRDVCGTWSVYGLSPIPVLYLPSLSASIDYARRWCNAAPATLELVVDGMYMVVYQERGWPRQLVASETDRTYPSRANPELAAATGKRLLKWLRSLWDSNATGGPAAVTDLETGTHASLRLR
jgi:hypothetical protein